MRTSITHWKLHAGVRAARNNQRPVPWGPCAPDDREAIHPCKWLSILEPHASLKHWKCTLVQAEACICWIEGTNLEPIHPNEDRSSGSRCRSWGSAWLPEKRSPQVKGSSPGEKPSLNPWSIQSTSDCWAVWRGFGDPDGSGWLQNSCHLFCTCFRTNWVAEDQVWYPQLHHKKKRFNPRTLKRPCFILKKSFISLRFR